MSLKEFYDNYCQQHPKESNIVLMATEGEILEINKKDESRHSLGMTTVIRYASPKTDINKLLHDRIDISENNDDFDQVLSEVELVAQPYKMDLSNNTELYFLPTHLEKIIKDIVCGGRKNKIPEILKKYIPDKISEKLQLKFITNDTIIVTNDRIHEYSTSFYKTYNQEDNRECSIQEVVSNINRIKYELNANFLEIFEYYFIGSIPTEIGLIQENLKETYPDPVTFHYNFWLLKDVIPLTKLVENFICFPFDKENIELNRGVNKNG